MTLILHEVGLYIPSILSSDSVNTSKQIFDISFVLKWRWDV